MGISLHHRSDATVAPLVRIRCADNVVAGKTRDGKVAIAAPLDYLPWVKSVDDFARCTDLVGTERWLLVSGKLTPRAQQELTTLSWRVSDNPAAAR